MARTEPAPLTHREDGDGDLGVAFPRIDGERSTTATGSAIFADAARAVSPPLAGEIEGDPDWYRSYVGHVRRLIEAQVTAPGGATAVPPAALDGAYRRFEFVRDGETIPLSSACSRADVAELHTARLEGRGRRQEELVVPYRGEELRGDALLRQLDAWTDAGTVEPSFAEAIRLVQANPDWLELSDRTVVVVGAAAEMGPVRALSRWNTRIVAIDLPGERFWRRIVDAVHDGVGTLSAPAARPLPDPDGERIVAEAGADVTLDLPELASWLARLDGPVTLGNYVYADGADNVRAAMAVDALAVHLSRRLDDLSLAVLATPTDAFAVPEETVEAAQRRFAGRSVLRRTVAASSRGRLFAPNYEGMISTPDGRSYGVVDCIVPQQGPNYALAKHLHRWRARLARDSGLVSSVNVAPPTRTRSVMKNRILAAAYLGAPAFDVEIFAPETSSTLMAAMLVHDLRNPASSAQPSTELDHPLAVFAASANHGGLWRQPFAPRTVLPLAVAIGMARRARPGG